MVCNNCGLFNQDDNIYCTKCGSRLSKDNKDVVVDTVFEDIQAVQLNENREIDDTKQTSSIASIVEKDIHNVSCQECNTSNSVGSVYCTSCGTKLKGVVASQSPKLIYCTKCGQSNDERQTYCTKCGMRMKSDSPIQTPSSNQNTSLFAQSQNAYENSRGRGMAIAGMVMGIISSLCFLTTIGAMVVAIIAMIFSIIVLTSGVKNKNTKGMAIAGLICSIVGFLLALMIVILTVFNNSGYYYI
ncbi:MAG: zinc-ribbon domain-containing protein [Firmicutes bacterium]|nr:zinc-ribbon domain-containing protein [Bacillota bacterium]MCL1953857.1 zinc-ribbon domain-containing protein [Bacillota bacterium]